MSEPSEAWTALNSRQLRMAVVPFGAAVFLVVLGAIAWACVPWKGEMTVDDTSSSSSVTVYGENRGGMNWCPGTSYSPVVVPHGGSVDISVAPNETGSDPCAESGNRLTGGADYAVTIVEAGFLDSGDDGFDTDGPGSLDRVADCMPTSSAPEIHELGTMRVDSNGKGDGTYSLPATFVGSSSTTPSEAAGICVTAEGIDGVPNEGNMAPLTIDSSTLLDDDDEPPDTTHGAVQL